MNTMMKDAKGTDQGKVRRELIPVYEEDLIGLPVVLVNAVVREVCEDTGEETIAIPDMDGLTAAVAMARCLLPLKLSSKDVTFLRKALDMTGRELAAELELAPETVSRWENDGQAMGGHSEKILRQYVCAMMHKAAPAIDYDPSDIIRMRIQPVHDANQLPPLVFERVVLKSFETRTKTARWDTTVLLAA